MGWVNAIVIALLRSPAHRVLSGRLIVLSYTGRRTGRRHTIPVGYTEHPGHLVVMVGHPERKQWWRNLREPAPVRVLLRGTWCTASGVVTEGEPTTVSITGLRPDGH